MSDFGTIITATSKHSLTESDEEKLTELLQQLIVKYQALNAEGELMNAQFEITDSNTAVAPLSDHYYGDEDPDDQVDFVEDNELDYAELLAEKLQTLFPDYSFEAKLERW